jgi:ABC-type iron transport system FetAB permease component
MNVFVDGVRTIIYVIFIVFVYPFVFDNNNWSLTVSFGSIILAALLFVVRKILKWRFFMFDENGKTIL